MVSIDNVCYHKQMPVDPMNLCRSSDRFCTEITNATYLEAQAELGGKLMISGHDGTKLMLQDDCKWF